MKEYFVKDLELVQNNQEAYIAECTKAYNKFRNQYEKEDSTWNYFDYNLFTLMTNSSLFYDLLKEISSVVRKEIVKDDRRVWLQSWVNFHKPDQILDWHHHQWDFHGYLSIDPKKTKTLFRDWVGDDATGEEWEIENKPGRLYIGPANIMHKVEAIEPFDGHRITIGLDFSTKPDDPIFGENKLIPIF